MLKMLGLLLICVLPLIQSAWATQATPLALRDFLGTPRFLSQATRVSSQDAEIKALLIKLQDGLPKKGEIQELPASLIKLVALSGAYCKKMVEKDSRFKGPATARRRTHKLVDFSKSPGEQTDEAVQAVLQDETGFFWGRAPSSDESKKLTDVVTEAKASLPDTPEGTLRFYTSLCVSIAASIDSWVY